MQERRLEVHERLHLAEDSLSPAARRSLSRRGNTRRLELRALVAVCLDPVGALHRKPGRVERMERLEERADAVAVLVDERLATDHAVADEERVARDVLERGHINRERRSEHRQQHDLDLECLLDSGAPRKAEHPIVVDDR